MEAQWFAHWPLMLEIPGSIPASREENLVSEHADLHVICGNVMNTLRHPFDQDVNWRLPVQGQSSPVQFKDSYTCFVLMHVGSSCKYTGVHNLHLPNIIRKLIDGSNKKTKNQTNTMFIADAKFNISWICTCSYMYRSIQFI